LGSGRRLTPFIFFGGRNNLAMKLIILFLIAGGIVWAAEVFTATRRRQKRLELLSTPFPPAWSAILKENLPPYEKLSLHMQQQLHDHKGCLLRKNLLKAAAGLS